MDETMPGISPNLLSALKRFSSCDVGDALVKLKIPYGGFLDGLSMYSPTRQSCSTKILGRAYTIRLVPASDTTSPTLPHHFADKIPRDSVVFVSQGRQASGEQHYSACWGGLMSTRASILGAAGVVVDGKFRDIAEHRELKFPLFAKGSSVLGAGGFTRASEVDVKVRYENGESGVGVDVNPGDLILADADGVVIIPPGSVEECVRLCEERAKIDEETFACLRKGEELGPTIKRLRK